MNKLFLLLSVACFAACSDSGSGAKDPANFRAEYLSLRIDEMENRIGELTKENAALKKRVDILDGQQKVCTDNFVGLLVRVDLLQKDLCPKCESMIKTDIKPKAIEE